MQTRTIERLPTLENPNVTYWLRRVVETVLAVGGPLAITGLIGIYHLYPRIPNISIVYLILILLLASSFGRYSSVLASIVAFLSFDYFLVPPLYTFTMDRWEEWIALGMFLVTALLTSQLTVVMRERRAQAQLRERELRILYELMRLMNTREQLDEQLDDVVLITLHVFNAWGVRACAILLPDTSAVLVQHAGASLTGEPLVLSAEEEALAIMAFRQKHMVEQRTGPQPQEQDEESKISFYQSMGPVELLRFIPLMVNEQVQGIFCFRIEHPAPWFASKARMDREQERVQTHITFFWSFLEQVTSLLERSHLRAEIMHQQF